MSTIVETLRGWALRDVVEDHRSRAGVGVLAFVLATSFGAQVAGRQRLTVPLGQLGLWIKCVDMRRSPVHEQVDNSSGPGREVR